MKLEPELQYKLDDLGSVLNSITNEITLAELSNLIIKMKDVQADLNKLWRTTNRTGDN